VTPPNLASQMTVSGDDLNARPVTRPGEILEAAPGLSVTQHSGEGKANQYFLRGFNLDHGTDIAISVDAGASVAGRGKVVTGGASLAGRSGSCAQTLSTAPEINAKMSALCQMLAPTAAPRPKDSAMAGLDRSHYTSIGRPVITLNKDTNGRV
jgi:TonB-dependent Receptor Plug Domain